MFEFLVFLGLAEFILIFSLLIAFAVMWERMKTLEAQGSQKQNRLRFSVTYHTSPNTIIFLEDITMLILTDTQKVSLSISPVSKAGNPAAVEGSPAWISSDETVLTLVVAPDGLSAVAESTGKLGTAQISVSADADLGEGVTAISGTLDVEVKAGQAVSLAVSAGAPEEK